MSTPSVTILKNLVLNWESNQMEEETIATFYRHYDGYPSCHAIDIASSLVVGAGSLRERGLGAAFPPFQQPAGRARNPPAIESAEKPSTWRKRGTDLPVFPTFRQAPGQSRNPPPIGMLKTPSSRETIGRRRGKAGHAAAAR